MGCTNLSSGLSLDCKTGVGGLREIFLANLTDVRDGTVTYDVSTDEVEGLPTMTVYRYELDKHLSNFEETGTYEDGGMVHFEQVITMVLKGRSSARRDEILKNVMNNRVVVFARDNNDKIKCFGILDGMDITSGVSSSGTVKGDLSGYTITFTGDEKEPAPYLEDFTTNPFDNFAGVTVSPAYAT